MGEEREQLEAAAVEEGPGRAGGEAPGPARDEVPAPAGDGPGSEEGAGGSEEAPRPRRRRRRRRGRGRAGARAAGAQGPGGERAGEALEAPELAPVDAAAAPQQASRAAGVLTEPSGPERPVAEARAEGPHAEARAVAVAPAEAAGAADGADPSAESAETAEMAGAPAAAERPGRRRRRRRGRGRRKTAPAGHDAAAHEAAQGPAPAPVPAVAGQAPAGPQAPATAPAARAAAAAEGRAPAARSAAPAGDAAVAPARLAAVAPPEAGPEAEEERPTRVRRARPGRRKRPEPVLAPRVGDKLMLITEVGDRDQIAVLEGRTLVEHYVTKSGARSMVGNVYLGKVQNVLPGMEAAFVDLGRGRNAVLYAGEVAYDEEVEGEPPRIEKVLKPGQNVLVQVTKDPMGGKGARLTQQIALPGRFVVLVPSSSVFGISRRLPERERARLRDVVKRIRPPDHGVIVRTAAEDASTEDLEADLKRLLAEWEAIEKSARRGRAPRLLYEEPELTVRVVRDVFTEGEFRELVTDSPAVFEKITSYLRAVAPDLVGRVRMHEGRLPLFEEYHVVEQIHKALDRKVWLPSGGYIVIDRTEAMTVIDVNTGKHVGKANLEETVTKTNLEAAEEIARQLRLRDIGGIIIIDFIDMVFERNRQKVIETLRNALAKDKTRSQVFEISPLGLLEVTRKRVSAGLLEAFSETCPTCEGRGIVLTHRL
jgi:ribonuclease E